MEDKLKYIILTKDQFDSEYTWINIEYDSEPVGKARVIIKNDTLVICSINIYPEFQRRGYAREIIDAFKRNYKTLIADRVRFTAIDFWVKMGFSDDGSGSYTFAGGAGKKTA